ncbi:MAG: phosphoserine phosphatase SerB, partial [Pseudomonadota bacterium]
ELDFISALSERVGLLAGLSADILQNVYNERVLFMEGAKELVATMRKSGAYTLLVSGGFTFFTARVAKELGFHEESANILEIIDGKLSGKVVPPILDKQSKLEALQANIAKQSIKASDVLAVGDGANDLPMLLAAGLGVAYHAKPIVQEQAKAKINYCDLTALLYAQGYKKEEFI